MKKDIEWLRGRIKGFQEGENMFTAEFNAGVQDALEYVQELINQLDEPETLSEEWIENHTASADTISYYSDENVPVVTVEKLKNLLVPKQDDGFVVFEKDKLDEEVQRMIDETYKAMNEKPMIPEFVADWIEAHNLYGNNPLREYRDLENDFNEGWTDEKDAAVYHWVNENPYAFIDALRYGCEVEKEKLYYVLDKEDATLLKKSRTGEGVAKSVGTNMCSVKSWKDEEKYQLTEQEIKDYDERYWAFAQEVTQ